MNVTLNQVGKKVLEGYWRQRPGVFRSALDGEFLSNYSSERFLDWTERTSGSVRLFQSFDDGSSRSGLLAEGGSASRAYTLLSASNAAFTIHMNDVEIVEPDVFDLRHGLGIPYWWRLDDVIGTLSSRDSGIGYHAGHEDGFIVQLMGSRRWRVWSDRCTPIEYRRELLAPRPGANPIIHRPEGANDLILDVELHGGDVLYIPPFFPHEGSTLDLSVSLSIAWKGLGPASFIPPSVYADLVNSRRLSVDSEVVHLFQEQVTAKLAIEHWEDATIAVIHESERDRALPQIRKSIEHHIHVLCDRYCSTV